MKKKIIILVVVLSFAILYGCKDYRGTHTTQLKYKYKIPATAFARYSDDTTAIRTILQKMLIKKTEPFDLKLYDSQTNLVIDSLIYGPDQLRMIVFVIARNSSTKLSSRENDSPFFYYAYYLFGSRQSMKDPINVFDYSGYRLGNFYDRAEISEALRDYCFNRMQRVESTEQYYNVDDKRFWNSNYFERVLRNSTATSE